MTRHARCHAPVAALLVPLLSGLVLAARRRLEAGDSRADRAFQIVVGDTLALTPPMGWNDWYTFYEHPSDALMRRAADIMIQPGLADHGYQYVNIDDAWMGRPKATDPDEQVPARMVGRISGLGGS